MYRLISESMLGLRRRGTQLVIEPALPEDWDTLAVEYTFGEGLYRIRFVRAEHAGIECDGVEQGGKSIVLSAEKQTHDVLVRLAR
jgi:cellobiose phosphorylase